MASRKPGRLKIKLAAILEKAVGEASGKKLQAWPEDLRDARGANRTDKSRYEYPWTGIVRDRCSDSVIFLYGNGTMGEMCRSGVVVKKTGCPLSFYVYARGSS